MNTLPNILPETEPIRVRGITGLKGIADELNRRVILTANGGRWYATRFAHDSSLEGTGFEPSVPRGKGPALRVSVSALASRSASSCSAGGSVTATGAAISSLARAMLALQVRWRAIRGGGCDGTPSAERGAGSVLGAPGRARHHPRRHRAPSAEYGSRHPP
jgi:hypothetical protein